MTPLPPPGRGGKRARGRRASARTGKHSRVKRVRLQVQRPAGDGDVQEVKPPRNPRSLKPWHGSGKSRGLSGDDFNPEGNSRGQEPALLNAQTPQELELCTRRGRVSKPDRGLQKKKRREESTPESLTRRPGKASSGEGRRESGGLVPESERKQLRSSSAGWEGGEAVKKSWHEDEEGRTGRGKERGLVSKSRCKTSAASEPDEGPEGWLGGERRGAWPCVQGRIPGGGRIRRGARRPAGGRGEAVRRRF